MTKRINVVLPVETIKVLDRVAPKGNRSRFISAAVLYYVESRAKIKLAERLKVGALANAQQDLEIAQEWSSLDQEAWQRARPARGPQSRLSPPGRYLFGQSYPTIGAEIKKTRPALVI